MSQTTPANQTQVQVQTPAPIYNQPPAEQYTEDLFTYSTGNGQTGSFGTIAPGATATATIQIEADSYFKWVQSTFFAWVEGQDPEATDATRPIPPILVTITDSGSGRRLMNSPVPVASIYGDGRLPFMLPQERFFLPRSTITFAATNLSATDTWNLILDHSGAKGYKSG